MGILEGSLESFVGFSVLNISAYWAVVASPLRRQELLVIFHRLGPDLHGLASGNMSQ